MTYEKQAFFPRIENRIICSTYYRLTVFYHSISKRKRFFSGTNTYYAIYSNLGGLEPTSPVSVLGLTAGTVDEISFDQKNTQMVVKIKLKKLFPARGTVAEIYSSDILGGKSVRLLLGEEPGYHRSGDTLASGIQRDLSALLTGDLEFIKKT